MARRIRTLPVPLIGIWWDDGHTRVSIAHAPPPHASRESWVDSHLAHWQEWKHVASHFGLTAKAEYFSIPRGRVLLIPRSGQGMIYHGSATPVRRLRLIAAEFQLRTWKHQWDEHYEIGLEWETLF